MILTYSNHIAINSYTVIDWTKGTVMGMKRYRLSPSSEPQHSIVVMGGS